jgi:hypothetical protein
MATLAYPGNLQTAQGGNADSTNIIQRNAGGEINLRQMILRIASAIGATPTVTVAVMGSHDGTNWFRVPYSNLASIAGAWSIADIVITTAATLLLALMPGQGWQYLKLTMSANTNVTLTSDLL